MAFGKDGKLYLTTGDAGKRDNAENNRNLHGSLLRLNDDGSVPSDNPFAADGTGVPCGQSRGKVPGDAPADAVCSEIWSWGLRNPFRMAMDPTASGTRFSVSDVGAQVRIRMFCQQYYLMAQFHSLLLSSALGRIELGRNEQSRQILRLASIRRAVQARNGG